MNLLLKGGEDQSVGIESGKEPQAKEEINGFLNPTKEIPKEVNLGQVQAEIVDSKENDSQNPRGIPAPFKTVHKLHSGLFELVEKPSSSKSSQKKGALSRSPGNSFEKKKASNSIRTMKQVGSSEALSSSGLHNKSKSEKDAFGACQSETNIEIVRKIREKAVNLKKQNETMKLKSSFLVLIGLSWKHIQFHCFPLWTLCLKPFSFLNLNRFWFHWPSPWSSSRSRNPNEFRKTGPQDRTQPIGGVQHPIGTG